MQSKWFRNAFESGMVEASSNTITLMDIDSSAARAMLEFLYCNNYNKTRDGVAKGAASALFNILVYSVADQYEVLGLAELSAATFADELAKHWDVGLFRDAVRMSYDMTAPTDELLRGQVLEAAAKHSKELLNDTQFLVEFANATSDFGVAFYASLGELINPGVQSYECRYCHAQWKAVLSEFGGAMHFCVSCGEALEGRSRRR